MSEHETQHEDLPPELIAALKKADKSVPIISSRVDRELSAQAAAQFGARSKTRRYAGLAVAASVMIAVFVALAPSPEIGQPGAETADLDGSGQVDIADVLYLARRSADQATIDQLAFNIVALDTPGEG